MPRRYKLITHTVEAIRLCPESAERAAMWCSGMLVDEYDPFDNTKKFVGINIPTLDGVKRASEGDYIVKERSGGGFSVWPQRQFEAQYELAE